MKIELHAPQIVWVLLVVYVLTSTTIRHGKPRSNEDAWFTLLGTVLNFLLLYWGGFFK